jgi:hypothetical protein
MRVRMQQKRMQLAALLLLSIGFGELKAQESIVAAGSNAYGHGGSVAFSVGEVVYSAYKGPKYSEIQGVQQPYDISVELDTEGTYNIELICSAYPNPVVDVLTLNIPNFIDENISYTLTDVNGKFLTSGIVTTKKTLISMSEYVAATYYLKVVQERNGTVPKETKVFKIIQNKR